MRNEKKLVVLFICDTTRMDLNNFSFSQHKRNALHLLRNLQPINNLFNDTEQFRAEEKSTKFNLRLYVA